MEPTNIILWLLLIGTAFAAVSFYWARVATIANAGTTSWFSAGHSLSPWISALLLAGISVSSWFILGTATLISVDGFVHSYLLQAGVLLALPGILFFKRAWFIAQRYRVSSQAELFRLYYKSDVLVFVVLAVSMLFAIGFSSLQLRAISDLIAQVTGGQVSAFAAGSALTVLLFSYVVIGGMRAVGYLGVIQTVCLVSASVVLTILILVDAGLYDTINAKLFMLGQQEGGGQYFEIAGVIQFVPGLGRGAFYGHATTATTNFTSAYALLGIASGPVALKVILSTKSTRGIAAGQTWVLAAFFGALIVLFIAGIGAAGLTSDAHKVTPFLTGLARNSPWLAAWVILGLAAGMQAIAGLSLLVASETLTRHVWKPYFSSDLNRRQTVLLTRICVVILAVTSALLAFLAPITTSLIGAFALPASAQLAVPMLGLCWFGWMTRGAVIAGVAFGLFGAFVTDAAGVSFLSYLGLDVPWGRYPWTLHAAAWGLVANVVVTLLVSAVTQKVKQNKFKIQIREFIAQELVVHEVSGLKSYAWAAGLAWMFLAVGPGLIFGTYAFVVEDVWILGFPSLWGWAMLFWLLGVTFVWFLAYKMQMASHIDLDIHAFEPPATLKPETSAAESLRLRNTLITLMVLGAIFALTVWGFGDAG